MSSTLQDRTLVIKNFDPEKTTRELLRELCMQAGPVRNVVMRPDHAFIEFADDESVGYSKALLDGVIMFGKKLIMEPKIRLHSHQKYAQRLTDCIRFTKQQKEMAEQQQMMLNQQLLLQQQQAQQPQPFLTPQSYPFQALLVPGPCNQTPIAQFPTQPANSVPPKNQAISQMPAQNNFLVPQTDFRFQQPMVSNPGHSGSNANSVQRSRSFNHHHQGRNNNRHHGSHKRPPHHDKRNWQQRR